MKKIMIAVALILASYQTNASTILYSGSVIASGSDTYLFTSATPFTLTFDLLTPPLNTFTLGWSVKDTNTNSTVYSTYFDMNTSLSAVTPVIQAGSYESNVSFAYPTTGVSVYYQLSITSVPVPAALYLFSSGLIGLLGIAKKKSVTAGNNI